jgi:HAD superfamily hydrolase (TIGR01509 family)
MEQYALTAAPCIRTDSGKFDLLLFDLDNTFVQRGHLEWLRAIGNIGNPSQQYIDELRKQARQLLCLIPQEILLRIRRSYPKIRLGVLTKAPRANAVVLLDACFPKIRWDCLVAFEDVPAGQTKPDPAGAFHAANTVGVDAMSRVAIEDSNVRPS